MRATQPGGATDAARLTTGLAAGSELPHFPAQQFQLPGVRQLDDECVRVVHAATLEGVNLEVLLADVVGARRVTELGGPLDGPGVDEELPLALDQDAAHPRREFRRRD